MSNLGQIEQLLSTVSYFLDGEDEDLPSYGEMANVGAIEQAIELAQLNHLHNKLKHHLLHLLA